MAYKLDTSARAFGMQISAEKTEMMTNNPTGISRDIKIDDTNLETVDKFRYLGAILSDQR